MMQGEGIHRTGSEKENKGREEREMKRKRGRSEKSQGKAVNADYRKGKKENGRKERT